MKYIHSKTLRYYITENGKVPFLKWLKSHCDATLQMRIRRRLDRLEMGNYGDYKSLGDGVFELRLAFGAGYRIYFSEQDNKVIILLCGGDKSSQKVDIADAKRYWKDLQERSDE